MILGLTGRAGSGKDTVYKRLVLKWPNYEIPNVKIERASFADKMKQSVANLLDLTLEEIEILKNSEQRCAGSLYNPMTMRRFLQRYGTESHREVFGDNFWVDAAIPPNLNHEGKIIVVTDVRFENEADRIRSLGGFIARVEGPDDSISSGASGHPSEAGVSDVDFIIDNTDRSTFDGLDESICIVIDCAMAQEVAYRGIDLREFGDPKSVEIKGRHQ